MYGMVVLMVVRRCFLADNLNTGLLGLLEGLLLEDNPLWPLAKPAQHE